MLAAASDYIQLWQVPIIMLFVFGWLVGGGFAFHHYLSKYTERKVKLGKGILVSFLAGLTGVILGFLAYKVGQLLLPPPKDLDAIPISWLGLLLALVFYLLSSYLVVYAMFSLHAGEIFSASVPAIGGVVLLAAVLFIPTGYFANRQVKEKRQQEKMQALTQQNMINIFSGLRRRPNDLPTRLEELLKLEGFDAAYLKSPANDTREIAFFYHRPKNGLLRAEEGEEDKILLCDYKGNLQGGVRAVMFMNGKTVILLEEIFQGILNKPINEDFAKALRVAEGGQ